MIRLPPPWTSTTGRRRATAATSSRTCAWSAIVVPPSLTTSTSLTSCTRSSRSRRPRSGRSRTPRRCRRPARDRAGSRTSGASIAARAAVAIEGDRAAAGAVEHEVPAIAIRSRSGSTVGRRARRGAPPSARRGPRPPGRPRRPAARCRRRRRSRPQFGSRPWTAALTRLLDTTARATARASASSIAPVTWQVISVVAPSPSAACWRARSRATASIAAPSAAASGVPAATTARAGRRRRPAGRRCRWCSCRRRRVSWFQVRAAAGRSSPWSVGGSTVASVSTNDSIVAIRGWIMPTPLAMPRDPDRADRDARRRRAASTRRGRRPWSASRSFGAPRPRPPGRRRSAASAGSQRRRCPARHVSTGSRVPISPVDSSSVSLDVAAESRGERPAIAAWSASPAAPVAALAQPLVETTAVAQPPPSPAGSVAARWACDRRTGAAANAFGVKTAAAAAGTVAVGAGRSR